MRVRHMILSAAAFAREHAAPSERVALLDGADHTYPRMLDALARAQHRIHLESYAFTLGPTGTRFVEALLAARRRGVDVYVAVDGWGSAWHARRLARVLRAAGCTVLVHNPLLSFGAGCFGRNHRKLLLVDDARLFVGGVNIHDEALSTPDHAGWADLTLEIEGPWCWLVSSLLSGRPCHAVHSGLRLHFSEAGGGRRLRRVYLRAFAAARSSIDLAHGYFIPDQVGS